MASSSAPELEVMARVHVTAGDISKDASAGVSRNAERDLRDDPEAKSRFLATFSAEEGAVIMKKVNRRFFVLIGLMYMIKQVYKLSDTCGVSPR